MCNDSSQNDTASSYKLSDRHVEVLHHTAPHLEAEVFHLSPRLCSETHRVLVLA